MKTKILATGRQAIAQAEADPRRVQLNKYQDAVSDAESDISLGLAREVSSEDPSLVFATVRTKPGYTDDMFDDADHAAENPAERRK